jgi:Tfp pilus assembly protein PilF
VRRYQKILKLSPHHVDTLTAYATLLWNSKKPHQAKDLFENAISNDPLNAPALTNYGMALLSEGRPLAALPHLQRAAAADPSNPDALLGLAIASDDAGDLPAAAVDRAYAAALAASPLSVAALHARGRFLAARAADSAQAERCYRRALGLAPDDHRLLLSYGTLLAEGAAFPRAEDCYRRALRARPRDPQTLYSYAMRLCRWEGLFPARPGDPPPLSPQARTPRLATADQYFHRVREGFRAPDPPGPSSRLSSLRFCASQAFPVT